jgi:hypothetical protein
MISFVSCLPNQPQAGKTTIAKALLAGLILRQIKATSISFEKGKFANAIKSLSRSVNGTTILLQLAAFSHEFSAEKLKCFNLIMADRSRYSIQTYYSRTGRCRRVN